MKKRNEKMCRAAACAAALCLLCGSVPLAAAAGLTNGTSASADETPVSATATLAHIGDSVPITASSELTEKPTWYSDAESVATVDENGLVTAVGKGTAYIYAVFSNAVYKFEVIVLDEETTAPQAVDLGSVRLNDTQYIVTPTLSGINNTDAKWSSSDTSVATVAADGTITAVGSGTCVVTAVYGSNTYTITIISEYTGVQPTTAGTSEGIKDLEMTGIAITLTDEQPSRQIAAPAGTSPVWSSSDEKIAVVDQNGVVTAVSSGKCRIYALVGNVRYYTDITSEYTGAPVQPRKLGDVKLSNDVPQFAMNLTNVPDGAVLVWSSSDESVATVDQNGLIPAAGSGKCAITVLINGIPYEADVESTYDPTQPSTAPAQLSIEFGAAGETRQLSASEGSEFISMNKDVATVDDSGLVTAVGAGETVIVVRTGNAVSQVKVTVKASELLGDANCDSKVNMADAVAILQCIANSEKYPLSVQGAINADCDGSDGLTGQDALVVLQIDAGVYEQ